MPGQAEHQALVDHLRQLRSEMRALVEVVEKSKGGEGSEAVVSQHRRRVAQIRTELEERLPQVLELRDQCVEAAQSLRKRAAYVRDAIQTVAQQAKVGQLGQDAARQRASEHENRFQHIWSQLEELEHRILFLHEFLPAARRATVRPESMTAPLPESASSANRPPVQAPLRRPEAPAVESKQNGATSEDAPLVYSDEDLAELLAPDEAEEAPGEDPLIEKSRAVYKKAARDRRWHPRVPFTAGMRYKNAGLSITARSADLCLGGMFVETPSTLPAGERLSVLFCAEGFPVEIDAVVVYETQGVGMGLKFGRIHEEDRAYLEALIRRLQAG